jgi:hypothetical protein
MLRDEYHYSGADGSGGMKHQSIIPKYSHLVIRTDQVKLLCLSCSLI